MPLYQVTVDFPANHVTPGYMINAGSKEEAIAKLDQHLIAKPSEVLFIRDSLVIFGDDRLVKMAKVVEVLLDELTEKYTADVTPLAIPRMLVAIHDIGSDAYNYFLIRGKTAKEAFEAFDNQFNSEHVIISETPTNDGCIVLYRTPTATDREVTVATIYDVTNDPRYQQDIPEHVLLLR